MSLQLGRVNSSDFGSLKGRRLIFCDLTSAEALIQDKRWSGAKAEIAKHLSRIRKELEKKSAIPEQLTPSASFKVHFEGESSLHVVLLTVGVSRYLLSSVLRKELAKEIVEIDAVEIHSSLHAQADVIVFDLVRLFHLESWRPESFGKKALIPEEKLKDKILRVAGATKSDLAALAVEATGVAESMNLVRTLSELPGNILNPAHYRARVEKLAKLHKLKLSFWDRAELKKRGAGAFLAVISADAKSEGGILRLEYNPPKAKRSVSLVGKGLCFDTGGYNLKGSAYMDGMHRDMIGSAVALSTLILAAKLKLPYRVTAFLALAENFVSETAYKANDVVIAANGTAIEVVDTDAEGRMVLADTLALASAEKPDLILDYATLTGAAVRAIETTRTCYFSNQENLHSHAQSAGELSGERVWNFPLGEDFFMGLKSEVADIKQCSDSKNADHIYAATFLSHFAGNTPWLHLDLAAAENKGGLGLVSTEVTAFGVYWSYQFLLNF